jgi:hypothetical protein
VIKRYVQLYAGGLLLWLCWLCWLYAAVLTRATSVYLRMQRVANGVLRRVVQDWGDFDLVVTSPMTRAIETSLLCMEGLDSPLPVILPLVTERGTSACDRGSPQGVLEERFPELNFAPLRDRLREEWWGVTDASRGYGDAWWAEEEIRYSGGGLSPDYRMGGTLL